MKCGRCGTINAIVYVETMIDDEIVRFCQDCYFVVRAIRRGLPPTEKIGENIHLGE